MQEKELRLEKFKKLRDSLPYRFEKTHSIRELRSKFEKDFEPFEICLNGKLKRVSNQDGIKVGRLEDGERELLVYFSQGEDPKEGESISLFGKLERKEGKVCLIDAKIASCEPRALNEVLSELELEPGRFFARVSARLMNLRKMGKAIFGDVQDWSGRVQVYLSKDGSGEAFESFSELVDIGDVLGIEGELFRTKAGELTIEVKRFEVLAKSLNPMPEKWHGLKDTEVRYRKRYLDLIVNEEARRAVLIKNRLIKSIREFLDQNGFIEVETPILQPIASGANARPFKTFHNALEEELYLRIAPELYLKKLVVGGLERVYELGRNFRNEGVDSTHNPEFSMVEFYAALWDYKDMMEFIKNLMLFVCQKTLGKSFIETKDRLISLEKFEVKTYFGLLEEKTNKGMDFFLNDTSELREFCKNSGVENVWNLSHGKLIDKVFSIFVEESLTTPTFVIDFPKLISPLARTHREDKRLVERFELYILGKEVANAYSELTDPIEQRERFESQRTQKSAGDEEAMLADESFIEALEYGLVPTAGAGIGIDRLMMVLTDEESIREVILFPALKSKGA
ncbi:MAG: lysine--tRNA ligase [Aquificaceae bacterium]|nr:lysine--tRNA ligase [Aquificaceae bacterium]